MSTGNKPPQSDKPELTSDELADVEAALIDWGAAVRSGAKFRVISLGHDDPTTVPSDDLDLWVHGEDIVKMFNLLISDENTLGKFKAVTDDETKPRSKNKITFAESRLIKLALRYLAVKEFLQKKHKIGVPSNEYTNWKKMLLDQAHTFMETSEREFSIAKKHSVIKRTDDISKSPKLADITILASIAVLETTKKISKIIDLSLREYVAPLTLDSALQLSELYSYCEMSYALLNIEDIKERAFSEIQAKHRQHAAVIRRSAIKEKLSEVMTGPNHERYRYKSGKRQGRVRIDFVAGLIRKKFEDDYGWAKKPPGMTILREEIRAYDES